MIIKSLGDYLALFDAEVRPKIVEMLARDDVAGAIGFENVNMSSSRCGERTSVIYGPGCTYKSLDDVKGKWLYDLPSQRQYPQYAYAKDVAVEVRGFGARGAL